MNYFITEKGANLLHRMGPQLNRDYYLVLDAIDRGEEIPDIYRGDIVINWLLLNEYIGKTKNTLDQILYGAQMN